MSDINQEILLNLVRTSIINKEIREATLMMLMGNTPKYFWVIPASSTGNHHPQYSLGDGGLVRHTIAAVKILKVLINQDHWKNFLRPDYKDCMISAMALHDTMKCGTQSEYDYNYVTREEGKSLTHSEHEMLVHIPKDILPNDKYRNLIERYIQIHMGRWGKYQPQILEECLVHEADMLASRKFIIVDTSMDVE